MSNITYTRRGSKTTRKISEAPLVVQKIWDKASNLGVNVLRVRVAQDRNELWFRRFVKLNEYNKGMQVLEVANNMDVENTLQTIDTFNKYENGGIIIRILRAIRSVFA